MRSGCITFFGLSLRDVELILAERGVVVTHESIRHWCLKFGADFASRLRRRRRSLETPGIWTRCSSTFGACCQHGVVLDILVQDRRNGAVAKRFFKRLLHGSKYRPRRQITDGLRSYGNAQRAHGRCWLSARSGQAVPGLATGDLRPSITMNLCRRLHVARSRLCIG